MNLPQDKDINFKYKTVRRSMYNNGSFIQNLVSNYTLKKMIHTMSRKKNSDQVAKAFDAGS